MIKSIKNFEGLYTIDELGQIFSISKNRYLTPNLSGNYPRIKLSKNNKDYMFAIHKLVASTFIGEPIYGYVVNHIDGNKMNYALKNLEYITFSDNSKHSYKLGMSKSTTGIKSGTSKLSEDDIINIYNSTDKYIEISKEYNISIPLVSLIKSGKRWASLDKSKLDPSKIKRVDNVIRKFDKGNFRNIEGYDNYLIDSDGNIMNIKSGKILKPSITNGYLRIFIDGKNYSIHILVAKCFVPNPDSILYRYVNHKDGNKLNNNYLNLEWCTASENSIHAFDNSLRVSKKGEGVGTSKLKNDDVLNIFNSKKSYSKLSKEFGISIGTISMIKNRKIWKHILPLE